MAIGGQNIGSDPEFFVLNRDGEAVSAHKLPDTVYKEGRRGYSMTYSVRRDGPALELNPSPMYCRDYIVPTYHHALMFIAQAIKESKTSLSFESSVVLSDDSFTGDVPDDVSEFGCQPDFSAYTLADKAPILPDGDKRRFAGGHIHMSIGMEGRNEKEPSMNQAAAAVFMDYLAALPAVAVLGATHAKGEAERRQFYGQAGSFRPKSYGIEYRTLSTKNLFLHPVMSYIMLQSAKAVADRLTSQWNERRDPIQMVKDKLDLDQLDEMRETINTHDYERAQSLVLDSSWKKNAKYFGLEDSKVFEILDAVIKASAEGVTWSDDIYHNWGLTPSLVATYGTVNHKFWGPYFVSRYSVDELIFPQYPFLDKEYKKKLGTFQKEFLRHPANPDFKSLGVKGGKERNVFA